MSFHTGSEYQRRIEDARRQQEMQADRAGLWSYERTVTQPPKVGARTVSVEMSEADIRRAVGAPEGATVEIVGAIDNGPNGTEPGRVIVRWREP